MSDYKINTFWSDKDKAFIATCPEFEGLIIVAKSRSQAVKEAESAIQDFIEIYQEEGRPIPKPFNVSEYSGQVRLRMSKHIHQRAAEWAEAEGISLNSFLAGAIEARLGVRDFHQRLLEELSSHFATSTMTLIQNQIAISAPTIINLSPGEKPQIPEEAAVTTG